MTDAALIIGYIVIIFLMMAGLAAAAVLLWAWFPVRFQWTKRPPSYLKTPTRVLAIDHMIGIGSRRKAKWFIGLMTVSPGVEPHIVQPPADRGGET